MSVAVGVLPQLADMSGYSFEYTPHILIWVSLTPLLTVIASWACMATAQVYICLECLLLRDCHMCPVSKVGAVIYMASLLGSGFCNCSKQSPSLLRHDRTNWL